MADKEKEKKLRRLTEIIATHVSLVDKGANWGGIRHHFMLKSAEDLEKRVPSADASPEDKRDAQMARSRQYGIEALETGANLSYPSGDPTSESLYGDPCNLKYPLGYTDNQKSPERVRNALSRFKGNYQTYKKESSRARVYERIVRVALSLGIDVSYDPSDPVDSLLPGDLKDRLAKSETAKVDVKTGEVNEMANDLLKQQAEVASMSAQYTMLRLKRELAAIKERAVSAKAAEKKNEEPAAVHEPAAKTVVEPEPKEVVAKRDEVAQLKKQLAERDRKIAELRADLGTSSVITPGNKSAESTTTSDDDVWPYDIAKDVSK